MVASANGRVFVGLDSEFFFIRGERVISAHRLLPSKHRPEIVLEDREGASKGSAGPGVVFHYDGVQGEFSAVESRNSFDVLRRVQKAIHFSTDLAAKRKISFSLAGCVPVPLKQLRRFPPDVIEFGCDIDFISWLEGMPNPIMCEASDHAFRYAGTHLHLGAPEDMESEDDRLFTEALLSPGGKIEVIKSMDYLVGNTSVMLDQSPPSAKRRELYGKAGTYRPTDYGVEYRVLSSFGLISPHFLPLLWSLSREAVRLVASREQDSLFKVVPPEDIITAINTNDAVLARKNWEGISGYLDGFFVEEDLIENGTVDTRPLKALTFTSEVGLENVVPQDIASNWNNELPTWSDGYFRLFEQSGVAEQFVSNA